MRGPNRPNVKILEVRLGPEFLIIIFLNITSIKTRKIIDDSPKYSTSTEKIRPIQNIHFGHNQTLSDNGRPY